MEDKIADGLSKMNIRSDNTRQQISDLANKVNTLTQVLGYRKPVRYEYFCHAQLIPVVVIGQVKFVARNWLVPKDEKTIQLYKHILAKLSDPQFATAHAEAMASPQILSDQIFVDSDAEPIVLSESIKV